MGVACDAKIDTGGHKGRGRLGFAKSGVSR